MTIGPRNRPNWDDYFMGLSFIASQRSIDPSTQHGCTLVDKDNHILAMGYNSFPAGMNDNELPLTKPEKYEWMEHSETNCVANSPVPVKGSRAYITGMPCWNCAKTLARHGVKHWIVADRHGHKDKSLDKSELTQKLIEEQGISVVVVKPNLNWMVSPSFIGELTELGFIDFVV